MYQVTISKDFPGNGLDRGFRVTPADSLLAVAKNHNVPIAFECEDGECGSCIVEVEEIGEKSAHHMTEKELDKLVALGAVSKSEAQELLDKDLMSKYRLACQCKVWSDLLVKPYTK